ncbi:MAG TPA: hypothetical protein PKZ17_07390 [Thermodesulfovibrio thiophilus]|nr:hypothetical protein [Thermodesulfovibrio thiophilus]
MQKSKQYVLINTFPLKEIFAFTGIFLGVLIFLFPAGDIEKRVLQEEDANLDLSIMYLENITRIHKSPAIFEALVERYAKKGDYVRASESINELRRLFPSEKSSYLRGEYAILKSMYFSTYDKQKRADLIAKMENILNDAVLTTNDEKFVYWAFKESIYIDSFNTTLVSVKKLFSLTKQQKWLQFAVDYAIAHSKYKVAQSLIEEYVTYCSDTDCAKFIIKSALATGDPGFAADISMKIAKKGELIQ